MFAVIFQSRRTNDSEELYAQWSERMVTEVTKIDGYLSHMSFRDPDTRQGVTISYFTDEVAIRRWREFPEHIEAQKLGRDNFYLDYTVQVAEIVREYSWSSINN